MRGFSLIETLIVITILTLMTSFLILYNRTGEFQIIILKEKASLISSIFKAKNLALGVLVQGAGSLVTCGYGVHFSNNGYFIYQDLASDCLASDHQYSGADSQEKLNSEVVVLSANVKLNADIPDILFVPPLPDVYFNGQRANGVDVITLFGDQNQGKSLIEVNSSGQITEK